MGLSSVCQQSIYEPAAKTAGRRLIRHRFKRVALHIILGAHPVFELFYSLRNARTVETLEDPHAQQHAHTAGGLSPP